MVVAGNCNLVSNFIQRNTIIITELGHHKRSYRGAAIRLPSCASRPHLITVSQLVRDSFIHPISFFVHPPRRPTMLAHSPAIPEFHQPLIFLVLQSGLDSRTRRSGLREFRLGESMDDRRWFTMCLLQHERIPSWSRYWTGLVIKQNRREIR